MDFKEKSYKVVSASAATLDTLAKPVVKHSHSLMIEGSAQIENCINGLIENIESSSHQSLGWVRYN